MLMRGIRGATTVAQDEAQLILDATKELLTSIVIDNEIELQDIASVFFTMTSDLHSVYPAVAAREIGWTQVPLFCLQELEVDNGLPHCIRVLLHWNTTKLQHEIKHIYLRGARSLRPDLVGEVQ